MLYVSSRLYEIIKDIQDLKLTKKVTLNFDKGALRSWDLQEHGQEDDGRNNLTNGNGASKRLL